MRLWSRWAAAVLGVVLTGLGSELRADGTLEDGTLAADELLTFEKHIRPILKAHCLDCHGAGEELQGALDLRLQRFMVRGGESGPAIQPGKPAESYLYQRVRDGEMPPGEKKLADAEVAIIGRWIAAGAATAREEPEKLGPEPLITPEERSFWSFQPIVRPPVPPYSSAERVRSPIDALLLPRLRDAGIGFSPDADKLTLMRRAYLDLIGLPPTMEEMFAYLMDDSTQAYERLVDRLLSSRHYGERWGRHWLDVAGYADSEGYTSEDPERRYAYKYRDYVIRSLNSDKPFDQFILEQLAGDELLQGRTTDLAANELDQLIATGFLRMAADGTASRSVDRDVASNQVMADTIKILTTSLLGLTVGCAQCHDHRYDPIPQQDYYRLRAVLEPAYDWKKWRRPAERLISLYTAVDRAAAAEVESEARAASAERDRKQTEFLDAALEAELGKHPESVRDSLRAAAKARAGRRTAEQIELMKKHPSLEITAGNLYQYNQKAADELAQLAQGIQKIRARKPNEDFISVLNEVPGTAPTTYLFHRGDPQQPLDPVSPGALSVTAPPGARYDISDKSPDLPTTGRRLAYARWLVNGQHPLVARVLVNRVWMHHFGRGIVGTPTDFGALGQRPTHPELLDWLASEFMQQGWSLKKLHQLVMTSTVYRQTSVRDDEHQRLDPDNIWYSRFPVQRLEAEIIRDRILATAGIVNLKMFGSPVPVREDEVGQIVVGVDKKGASNTPGEEVSLDGEEFRRSIYIQVRRTRPLGLLRTFDAPVMEVNCDRRFPSTGAPQSLMLMNSRFILEQSERMARRLQAAGGTDLRNQLAAGWLLAYQRPATEEELEQAGDFVREQVALHRAAQPAAPEPPKPDGGEKRKNRRGEVPPPDSSKKRPELLALTDFCQALLSSNEFLYVD